MSDSASVSPEARKIFGVTMPLMGDLFLVKLKMEENDNPLQIGFWRRNYVRALFALIEGNLFRMKLLVLDAHDSGTKKLALGDEVLLREQSFKVDRKGSAKIVGRFLTFEDNLKLTFRCLASLRHPAFELDTSGAGWSAFKRAVEIRHRVTHPKREEDMEITDRDMRDLEHAEDWFDEMNGQIAFPGSNVTMPQQRLALCNLVSDRADEWSSLFECNADDLRERVRKRIAKEKRLMKERSGKAKKTQK